MLKDVFTEDVIEHFKHNKHEITEELLEELRSHDKEGKQIALDILDLFQDDESYYLDAFGNRISQNGNRRIKKPFTKLPLSDIHIQEIKKCSEDIFYFMNNYVKIVTPKGISFPDLREYQLKFIETVVPAENESVVSLQPRQCCSSNTSVKVINDDNEYDVSMEELFNNCKKDHTAEEKHQNNVNQNKDTIKVVI